VTSPLITSVDRGIFSITLNRPEKRNALNAELIDLLHEAVEQADLDHATRVVLIRAAGKDFCAGADLEELLVSADRSIDENEKSALRLGTLFQRIRELPKPVVALVQGRALAGGAGLATACDVVVASTTAQLGYPEIQRGFVPAMVMAILRASVGEKRALDLVLNGTILTAEEALNVGLVTRVVPEGGLEREGAAIASRFAGSSTSAVALTKKLFYQLDGLNFAEGISLGARVNAVARSTPDFREAIARFLKP
jgi:methylglutaconyl-CoA hydratase